MIGGNDGGMRAIPGSYNYYEIDTSIK